VLSNQGRPGEYKEQKNYSGKKKNHAFKKITVLPSGKISLMSSGGEPGPKK